MVAQPQVSESPRVSSPPLPVIDPRELLSQRRENALQMAFFLVSTLSVLGCIAFHILGYGGLWAILWLLGLFFFLATRIPSQLVLDLHQAQPIGPGEAEGLITLARALAHQAALSSSPQLYWSPGHPLNAFSTGTRKQPCIVFSQGLLDSLSEREMAGVIAHEMAHLANGDVRLMILCHLLGKALAVLGMLGQLVIWINLPLILKGDLKVPLWFLLAIGLGPTAMRLVSLQLSRVREYNADLWAVKLTGDPLGLTTALQKISCPHELLNYPLDSEQPQWLSTHPSTKRRIKKIQAVYGCCSPVNGQGCTKDQLGA